MWALAKPVTSRHRAQLGDPLLTPAGTCLAPLLTFLQGFVVYLVMSPLISTAIILQNNKTLYVRRSDAPNGPVFSSLLLPQCSYMYYYISKSNAQWLAAATKGHTHEAHLYETGEKKRRHTTSGRVCSQSSPPLTSQTHHLLWAGPPHMESEEEKKEERKVP